MVCRSTRSTDAGRAAADSATRVAVTTIADNSVPAAAPRPEAPAANSTQATDTAVRPRMMIPSADVLAAGAQLALRKVVGLKHHATADHGLQDFDVGNLYGGNVEKIAIDDDQIRELSHFERAGRLILVQFI